MKLRFLLPAATAIALAAPAFAQQSTPREQGEGMRRMEQTREHMPDRGDGPPRERHGKKSKHCGMHGGMHGGGHDGMHEMMHMMMMHHMMHEMMHDDDDAGRHGMGRGGMMERRGMMRGDDAPRPQAGMAPMEGRGQMRAQMAAELEQMREQIAQMQEMIESLEAEVDDEDETLGEPKE
jgi:hypothetical protein